MLTTLSNSNVPVLTPAASFIKRKALLVVGYVFVGLLLILAGFALTQWVDKLLTKNRLAKTQAALVVTQTNVNTLTGIKDQQVRTIGTLNELRELDHKQMDKLAKDKKKAQRENAILEAKVAQLEAEDEDVRNYLNQPIPPSLACVLNDNCPAKTTGDGGEGRGPGSAEDPDRDL